MHQSRLERLAPAPGAIAVSILPFGEQLRPLQFTSGSELPMHSTNTPYSASSGVCSFTHWSLPYEGKGDQVSIVVAVGGLHGVLADEDASETVLGCVAHGHADHPSVPPQRTGSSDDLRPKDVTPHHRHVGLASVLGDAPSPANNVHSLHLSSAGLRAKLPPPLPCSADECAATVGAASIAPSAKPDISVLASAVAASKLGLVDNLSAALTTSAAVAFAKDAEDRTCLHYAAGYGHEECVGLLLEHRADPRVRDANGDVPLHFAAIHGHPMCAYSITKQMLIEGSPVCTTATKPRAAARHSSSYDSAAAAAAASASGSAARQGGGDTWSRYQAASSSSTRDIHTGDSARASSSGASEAGAEAAGGAAREADRMAGSG
ncbi:Ankyrin repeat domain-containing protein 55 [Tetrabaena socialis]|uniref:Ankyrin repeat domain-containing protein 55 n=1 Tax=Tetrabaena socialis TaxID=47790 RepID=A0A2J7ZI96_9CHLO|nr:Ankyrin repeat domain-containing protein 55 [Tetrabaena socialis]|eukprot:PNG99977.1 Ankyrin repeat domain-containing protein 55 [Tetrabaena socialis]